MTFPKHYSLHSDEDRHFVIHDKRDNKTFKVSKKDIHPASQIKIMKMQKLSDGGSVNGDDDLGVMADVGKPKNQTSESSPWDRLTSLFSPEGRAELSAQTQGLTNSPPPMMASSAPIDLGNLGGLPSSGSQVTEPPAPDQSSGEMPVNNQPQAGAVSQMPSPPIGQGLSQAQSTYENAILAGAKGQQAQNSQIAGLQAQHVTDLQDFAVKSQENIKNLNAQADALSKDIASQKIDPERFWNKKDTGSKFSATLGIILSGIGAGLAGGPNMAMDVLQKSIDRDIQSQKDELGKKQTLLSDNFRQQGNLHAAEAATRLQYEAIFQGKLAGLAAKTNNPMVIAQAQKEIFESRLRSQPSINEVNKNQMVQQFRGSLNNAKGTIKGDPSSYVPYLVPDAKQAEVFKEIKTAQDIKKASSYGLDAFDEAVNELKSAKPGSGGIIFSPSGSIKLKAALLPTVQDVEGSVREFAMKSALENYNPTIADVLSGRDKAKRDALVEYYNSKSSAPVAKGFGIDLGRFDSTAPINNNGPVSDDEKMLNWAKNNPRDKRSAEIMSKLGAK